MSVIDTLQSRAEGKCELCSSLENLDVLGVAPHDGTRAETSVLACAMCREQISGATDADPHHWRCLNESMWSTEPAVQVVAWRMLDRLRDEGWAQDLADMLYLDEETLTWAKSADAPQEEDDAVVHKDTFGAVLVSGDTVTLIKDLKVKGAGFTAKRGTAVRNISLVSDNAQHIEGRVEGQHIVILTEFVKRSTKG